MNVHTETVANEFREIDRVHKMENKTKKKTTKNCTIFRYNYCHYAKVKARK